MSAPKVLFGSCTQHSPQALELVKSILSPHPLPVASAVVDDVEGYSWHVDTKYYTADVLLCVAPSRTIGDKQFAESVQAVILTFSSEQVTSFDVVKSWLPFVKEIRPAIQILVCDTCTENSEISYSTVQKWCLENSFELVELSPQEDSDSEEDDFAEDNGIKRIIGALHAHTWPNLEMKDDSCDTSTYLSQMMAAATTDRVNDRLCEASHDSGTDCNAQAQTALCTDTAASGTKSASARSTDHVTDHVTDRRTKEQKTKENIAVKESTHSLIDSLLSEDMALINALGNDDAGDESFEHLFERMKIMKDKANSLPPEQRKAYAEKVAISFWKAIGGDEDEISGLSDSD